MEGGVIACVGFAAADGARAWAVDYPWRWFLGASAGLFLVFAALKRGTRVLEH